MTSPPEPPTAEGPTATVVGTGLIGASIGLGLRRRGWLVHGVDRDPAVLGAAVEAGAVDRAGRPERSDLTFLATPVAALAGVAAEALAWSDAVTDVGSVKAPVVAAVDDARFVGGHPMAGSEQEGVAGASADLFEGAVWVLTPTERTDTAAHSQVRAAVSSLGAEVLELAPEAHDELVAVVSHVPHLAAATLMALAADRSEERRALLRLAAGGFRDMTRIAAGHPGIWPDICEANRAAITDVLDGLLAELSATRDLVAAGDRGGITAILERARHARLNLPRPAAAGQDLAVVRVPVPDRKGVLADVTTLATDLDVNIWDVEIAHSSEGDRGVLIMVVEERVVERFTGGLMARGYRPSARPLD